jgi:hypothetical protein
MAHSFRNDHRNTRPFAEELRPLIAKGATAAGYATLRAISMTPLAIAAPRPHIANDGLAAFMDMHMLDPHVLRCAMLEAPQKLHRSST